jgi:glutamyl-tRNA synthetase
VQVQIFEALGYAPPTFGHLALLKTKDGELSKRLGGNDIRALRKAGILPMAVNSLLAKIGTSDAVEPFVTLDALAEGFDFKKFGRAPANYDVAELEKVNEKLLHQLPFDAVKDKLEDIKEVRGVYGWSIEDVQYIATALELLPEAPWDTETWGKWTKTLSEKTGRKGKELFMPLRKILTGYEHGPEMKILLSLMKPESAKRRLRYPSQP